MVRSFLPHWIQNVLREADTLGYQTDFEIIGFLFMLGTLTGAFLLAAFILIFDVA